MVSLIEKQIKSQKIMFCNIFIHWMGANLSKNITDIFLNNYYYLERFSYVEIANYYYKYNLFKVK